MFEKRFSSVEDELMMYGISSVFELYVNEFLKNALKSNNNLHSEKYLHNLFVFFPTSLRNTRSCNKN